MRKESGQILVEVLVALGLFVVIISAVIIFFFNGQLSALSTVKTRKALDIARNGIEAVRFIRDADWVNMTDGQYGLEFVSDQWQFTGTSDTTGEYTRVISISTYESDVKQVTSRVIWHRIGKMLHLPHLLVGILVILVVAVRQETGLILKPWVLLISDPVTQLLT
jgi:type II secretory pathway pseudopilin PulG